MLARLLVTMVIPSIMLAQEPATTRLKPANGAISAGSTNVSSMQELRDGRVLIADLTAGRMGFADFGTGKIQLITDVNPGRITPLAADTSLLAGITQAQWVFLLSGRPIGMLPAGNPVVERAREFWGADSLGHALATLSNNLHPDSVHLILVVRSTADVDTVASLWQGPRPASDAQRRFYGEYEHGLLGLDGWIAVLRTAPYRVDWRTPSGQWVPGAPIPYHKVEFTPREKLFVVQQRARGSTVDSPESVTNWPATIAPWNNAIGTVLSPDGELLVRRTLTADFPDQRYDVINRHGERERQIMLAPREKILGFGTSSVYVIVTGDDAMQRIERHPWP